MAVDKDVLREFYTHVFPVDLLYQWLSYGSAMNFHNREISYASGEFVRRFMTFANADALRAELIRVIPEKIDFGAIFSTRCDKKPLTTLNPVQRELIIDIDVTDYDDVRFCCSQKDICSHCWKFMSLAVHTLSDIIRNELGFKHFFWVYSGRRGIHCWICDVEARKLTDAERSAIVGYLNVYEGAMRTSQIRTNCDTDLKRKKWLHPTLRRVTHSYLRSGLNAIYLQEDNTNCIWTNDNVKNNVSAYFKSVLQGNKADKLMDAFMTRGTDYATIHKVADGIDAVWALEGFLLAFFYPRLDLNVSKARNHLLKSPFVVHPSTERLCVSLSETDVDTFDPINDPPKLKEMVAEVHAGHPMDLSRWYRPVKTVVEGMRE